MIFLKMRLHVEVAGVTPPLLVGLKLKKSPKESQEVRESPKAVNSINNFFFMLSLYHIYYIDMVEYL